MIDEHRIIRLMMFTQLLKKRDRYLMKILYLLHLLMELIIIGKDGSEKIFFHI